MKLLDAHHNVQLASEAVSTTYTALASFVQNILVVAFESLDSQHELSPVLQPK